MPFTARKNLQKYAQNAGSFVFHNPTRANVLNPTRANVLNRSVFQDEENKERTKNVTHPPSQRLVLCFAQELEILLSNVHGDATDFDSFTSLSQRPSAKLQKNF